MLPTCRMKAERQPNSPAVPLKRLLKLRFHGLDINWKSVFNRKKHVTSMTATSAVEFLIWLLIAASAIAILAKRLHAPYTVALVAGGLILGALRLPHVSPLDPGQRPEWLSPDVILILFLPALVFEGSVKLNVRHLVRNSAPLLLLAIPGVLLAADCHRLLCPLDDRPAGADRASFRGDNLSNRSNLGAGHL